MCYRKCRLIAVVKIFAPTKSATGNVGMAWFVINYKIEDNKINRKLHKDLGYLHIFIEVDNVIMISLNNNRELGALSVSTPVLEALPIAISFFF